MEHIEMLYCCIDDFCNLYEEWERNKLIGFGRKRIRSNRLSLSEMLTIEVLYHLSGYKNFKKYYTQELCRHKELFPNLLSYNRFIELKPRLITPLSLLLHCLKGQKTGIYYVDATKLAVCHNKRTSRHQVFKGLATMGKSSYGWFMGLKLHMIINDLGEIMSVKITKGNVDDRTNVPQMAKELQGKMFGDKGYISKDLFAKLKTQALRMITGIKKNMKAYLLPMVDKILLRKRALIETVFGMLKTTCNLEHTRHRSQSNFIVNALASLVAYSFYINFNKQLNQQSLIPN